MEVGYLYQEVGCDSGSGDHVGFFQSRVVGLGPQVGYLFPIEDLPGYLNLKAYGEFAAKDRPDGWNIWLTFSISPAAPTLGIDRCLIAGNDEHTSPAEMLQSCANFPHDTYHRYRAVDDN